MKVIESLQFASLEASGCHYDTPDGYCKRPAADHWSQRDAHYLDDAFARSMCKLDDAEFKKLAPLSSWIGGTAHSILSGIFW